MILCEMFMHYIVRTLIFQRQYFMNACDHLVIGDKSKYSFTLINKDQKKLVFFWTPSFFSPRSTSTIRQQQVFGEQKVGAFRTAAVSRNIPLDL